MFCVKIALKKTFINIHLFKPRKYYIKGDTGDIKRFFSDHGTPCGLTRFHYVEFLR